MDYDDHEQYSPRYASDQAYWRGVKATQFLHLAAGSPLPHDAEGGDIPPKAQPGSSCASCGAVAMYRLDQSISDNFTTMKNNSRAWPVGGDSICAACLWCCRSLALRCGLFFARLPDDRGRGGIWFTPVRPLPGWENPKPGATETWPVMGRPDPLAALLAPPPAPFVAGFPLYGIDHGGEANSQRVVWQWTNEDGTQRRHVPGMSEKMKLQKDGTKKLETVGPLIKIQSKHTALYCRISGSSERYHLQVDDALDVMVDVPLWRSLLSFAEPLLDDLRGAGVGAQDARASLVSLKPPAGAPISLLSTWSARVAPFVRHASASWWSRVFVALMPMPDLVIQPKKDRAT